MWLVNPRKCSVRA